MGYMGPVIERVYGEALRQTRELERLAAERQAAEEQASPLLAWQAERDEMLRPLSHEVRQPLNSVTDALQAARKALAPLDVNHAVAFQRVQRAELVLGQITGTLDNTLAATVWLASPYRVERRDGDVDAMRTALMDAGLMRLTLCNLLSNAMACSSPGSPVVLRVSDMDEPLSRVVEVVDQGPGIEPALASRLFERGVRGRHGGTIFRLELPQEMPHRRRKRRERPDQASPSAARKTSPTRAWVCSGAGDSVTRSTRLRNRYAPR